MSEAPVRFSRSKLDLFTECPRCFWLDVKMGVKRPQPYPYTLSAAVDQLLKAEFDQFRRKGEAHPLMKEYGVNAKLFADQDQLSIWRNNFKGISYMHPGLGITLYGAVDDIFEFPEGKLAVVDYKSTGSREITIYPSYQLQMDIYTWLLEKNGYPTVRKAYFVFYQVDKTNGFEGRLPFRGVIKDIETNPDSVEKILSDAAGILESKGMPPANPGCQYCLWQRSVAGVAG